MKNKFQKQQKPGSTVSKITASSAAIAKMFDLNQGTLANMRSKRIGPKFFKVGRKILYRISDVEQWVFDNPVVTSDSLPASQCGGVCYD